MRDGLKKVELKLKLITASLGGSGWIGGWTKTKLMLNSPQLKLKLSLAKTKLISPDFQNSKSFTRNLLPTNRFLCNAKAAAECFFFKQR